MTRRPPELARLQDIGVGFHAGKIGRDAALAAVIDVILGRLQCSRVSLWRFDGPPGELVLLCFAAKRPGAALEATEGRLTEAKYRAYFDGLVRTGVYVSDDAMNDPDLQPMCARYLLPNRVRSRLDAAFMVNGRAHGIVCFEQTDAIRHWRADEIASLRSIVAKLALLMATGGDSVLWASASLPMAPIARRSPAKPSSGGADRPAPAARTALCYRRR